MLLMLLRIYRDTCLTRLYFSKLITLVGTLLSRSRYLVTRILVSLLNPVRMDIIQSPRPKRCSSSSH